MSPSFPVQRLTLWRVFWRSLFLQAAFNPRGMQNVGFAFALYPALRELYPDQAGLREAVQRHLRCFNTHPYVAAAIVGGALHHEALIARGEGKPESVQAFKGALMGPLAALGDSFFWFSLRPACGALSALLALFFAIHGEPVPAALFGAALFLASYNGVALALRARFFLAGVTLGDGVISRIEASHLPKAGGRLRLLAAGSAGAAAGLAALSFPSGFAPGAWGVAGVCATFLAAFALLGRGASPYAVAYGASALGLFLGLVF